MCSPSLVLLWEALYSAESIRPTAQTKSFFPSVCRNPVILVCIKPYCTLAERWKNIHTPSLLLPRSTDLIHKTTVTTNIHVSFRRQSSTHTPLPEGKATHLAQEPSHPAAVPWFWHGSEPAKPFKALGHCQKFYKPIHRPSHGFEKTSCKQKNSTKD